MKTQIKRIISLVLTIVVINCVNATAMASTVAPKQGLDDFKANAATSTANKVVRSESGATNKLPSDILRFASAQKDDTIILRDPPLPWKVYFQSDSNSDIYGLTATAIVDLLILTYGGPAGAYYTIANSFVGGVVTSSYEKVYVHQVLAYVYTNDPTMPYYNRQTLVFYKDAAHTQTAGYATNYFYSETII